MTDRCKGCKSLLDIIRDKYYRVTVEYDTYYQERKNVFRFHKKCWDKILAKK